MRNRELYVQDIDGEISGVVLGARRYVRLLKKVGDAAALRRLQRVKVLSRQNAEREKAKQGIENK